MSYKAYNDYELLYLSKEENDQVALEILIKKYTKFIYKKVISFFPYKYDVEDYFQEGLICLIKAVESFKDVYNKTFMRYFEVLLDRRFINIYHKNRREIEKYSLLINEAVVEQYINEPEEENEIVINIKFSSEVEEIIYNYYFQEGKKVSYIVKQLNLTRKQVYNAIYRVKGKLTAELKKEKISLL